MSKRDSERLSEQLSAYLDDELTERERQAVERALLQDPAARARLTELERTARALRDLPRRRVPESLFSDLTAAAERCQLLGDIGPRSPSAARRAPRFMLALAASIALLAAAGWWMLERIPGRHSAGGPALALKSPEPAPAAPERAFDAIESLATRGPATPLPTPLAADSRRAEPSSPQATATARPLSDEADAAKKGEAPGRTAGRPVEGLGLAEKYDDRALYFEKGGAGLVRARRDAEADGASDAHARIEQQPAIVIEAKFKNLEDRDACAARLEGWLAREREAAPAERGADDVSRNRILGDEFAVQTERPQLVAALDHGYVVQVPTEQLSGCLAAVAEVTTPSGDVRMTCGPLTARGPEQVQLMVSLAQPGPAENAGAPQSTPVPGEERKATVLREYAQRQLESASPNDAAARRAGRAGLSKGGGLEKGAPSPPAVRDAEKEPAKSEDSSRQADRLAGTEGTPPERAGLPRWITLRINLAVPAASTSAPSPESPNETRPADAP